MAIEHLTDEQIQSYVDGNSSLGSTELLHLNSCENCQSSVKEYKLLFGSISKVEEPELSPAFTSSTMAQITALAQPQIEKQFDWQTSLFVAFGAVSAVAVMIYIFGYKAILEKLQTVSLRSFFFENSAVTSIKGIFTQLGDAGSIIIFAALIIGFYVVLDIVLKKYKAQKISLLSI